MSFPPSGTYKISNVKYPTNQLFDLKNGKPTDGTPIIGLGNSKFKSGDMDNLWTLQTVTSQTSGSTVRLVNVQTGTFARPDAKGLTVVGGSTPTEWTLVQTGTLGQYRIETMDGLYACALTDGNDTTNVTLQGVSSVDLTQVWMFCPT
ncbi:hypothetical protein DFH29DRAFT_925970 [Suillus ampliporus]|nr:hypothetical protein DFH29DRAFT_925970 [Suillus ampliporus]